MKTKKLLRFVAIIFWYSSVAAQDVSLKELLETRLRAEALDPLIRVSNQYFRSQPFTQRFSSYIGSLQKDPLFILENYQRRNDSTFFYVNGMYEHFNPFSYAAKEVKLIVAEEQIHHLDSTRTPDTIINLQLMGLVDTGEAGAKLVQKEFKRFHRNYSSRFGDVTYDHAAKKGIITAEMHNYFFPHFSIAHVTTAWGQIPDTQQYTFTLTIRFKVKENQATLILFPGEMERGL